MVVMPTPRSWASFERLQVCPGPSRFRTPPPTAPAPSARSRLQRARRCGARRGADTRADSRAYLMRAWSTLVATGTARGQWRWARIPGHEVAAHSGRSRPGLRLSKDSLSMRGAFSCRNCELRSQVSRHRRTGGNGRDGDRRLVDLENRRGTRSRATVQAAITDDVIAESIGRLPDGIARSSAPPSRLAAQPPRRPVGNRTSTIASGQRRRPARHQPARVRRCQPHAERRRRGAIRTSGATEPTCAACFTPTRPGVRLYIPAPTNRRAAATARSRSA